jgi:murein DD-endopeptidase MepM/ murein hydrolase activator NlpD
MKTWFSLSWLEDVLLSAAKKIGRRNGRLFAAGMVIVAGGLLILTLGSAHHDLHAVTGPAGGSMTQAVVLPARDSHKVQKKVTVSSGDTLLGILSQAGVESQDAAGLIAALSAIFGPRDLQPGQTISLSLSGDPAGGLNRLEAAQIKVDSTRDIVAVVIAPGEFTAQVIPRKVAYRPTLVSGSITTSLYGAAQSAGLPLSILMEMIRAYSFSVDFQRDVHPGDAFQVIYRKAYDSEGRFLANGDMLFAALTLRGRTREIYEYTTSKGYVDYFNSAGQSVRKMLIRTPVEGAWVSSVFGWRKNPLYGYGEFHRGLDLAVPMNTPVMAAGNGTVMVAGYSNGYGNYIRLRHANGYQTLYAHMDGFARGIRVGSAVSQGQVIGYVGTTGMSTGPHLHYEIIYRGKRINPATIVSPSGPILSDESLAKFRINKERIDGEYTALKAGMPIPAAQGLPF